MSHKILLLLLLISTLTFAQNTDDEAHTLFTEAQCMDCHNEMDFTPKKNKVSNFKKLHKSVTACAFTNNANWFDDEILDVTHYLNKKHYKFKEIPQEED